jgi:hypothetical protein
MNLDVVIQSKCICVIIIIIVITVPIQAMYQLLRAKGLTAPICDVVVYYIYVVKNHHLLTTVMVL